MTALLRVENPPAKPTLLWDGECGFCGRCARWMNRQTGDAVAYRRYQQALADYPELSEDQLAEAVHFVDAEGEVTRAAEAIYAAMATQPRYVWLACWYRKSRLFAMLSEWGYRRVANNRSFISWLTRSRQRG